jgi:DNA-binding transcriptional ArsR family regulator/uncharacterized coiled-coil protein SlyX
MTEEEDGEKEALQEDIQELSTRVAELEEVLSEATRPIGDLWSQLEAMKSMAGNYFRLLELYQRDGKISPEAVLPELKDPISIEIVRVLFDQGDLNVSELTERLRARRGSASRTSVRERLIGMAEEGIVVVEAGPKGVSHYSISEGVMDKWFRLLGLRR